ncbi:MAG: hypothetical protein GVY20_16385 [Bacteroidetes bacterium]|nr:hypothetical protein [Bacteroidota bacterium]
MIDIVTPGGGLMKSGALKKDRNPGIGTYSKPGTPRRWASKKREISRGVTRKLRMDSLNLRLEAGASVGAFPSRAWERVSVNLARGVIRRRLILGPLVIQSKPTE